MKVQFYKTRNDLLKPFLEGYYCLFKEDNSTDVTCLTFPNNIITVSAYHHVQVSLEANYAIICEDQSMPFKSVLVSNYKVPIKVTYQGQINEITFCFKPLGLHSLLPDFTPYLRRQLNDFEPFDDYRPFISSVLSEPNHESKMFMIEDYWLSKLNGFDNPLLNDLVVDLTASEFEISISDLAAKYATSRQNIFKLFDKYVGKSPVEFKKTSRFRMALNNSINALKEDKNLTSLSYESLFYDQSHMVKDFKSLTGLTPKQFFGKVALKSGAGNWLYLN